MFGPWSGGWVRAETRVPEQSLSGVASNLLVGKDMTGKTLIVANPKSGSGRGMDYAERVRQLLTANEVPVDIRPTSARGDAEAFASEAVDAGYACVAACGGDGTVHEVVNALGGTDVALGMLPCGRGNDFARAMGIPAAPEKAASVLMRGHIGHYDLGKVNGRYFATVVTLGFDSEVARLVYGGEVPLKGMAAYLWGVARMLRVYRGVGLRMTGDFGTINQTVLLAATGNTSTYGGGIRIAPKATPTDGQLDICLVRMMSASRILRVFPRVYWGGHLNHPSVFSYRTSSLRLETEQPVVLFADGEPVGESPAEIVAVPRALRIVCPDPAA